MSKSELSHLDVTLFVPLAFFVNAYMSLGVPEHFILLLSLVSISYKILCWKKLLLYSATTQSISNGKEVGYYLGYYDRLFKAVCICLIVISLHISYGKLARLQKLISH